MDENDIVLDPGKKLSTRQLEADIKKAAEDEEPNRRVMVGDWIFIAHLSDMETGESIYVTMCPKEAPRHAMRGLANELTNRVHRM